MQNTKESSGTESNGKTPTQNENVKQKKKRRQERRMIKRLAENNRSKYKYKLRRKTTKDPKKSVAVKTSVKEVAALVDSLDKQLAANPKLETVNKLENKLMQSGM